MVEAWPTVGRHLQRNKIEAALRARQRPNGIVLTGGAGVGKTTIVREAIASYRRRHPGLVLRWAAGTESASGIPLGAFAHLVRIEDSQGPAGVVRAATDVLAAPGVDVVIAVDDAHLLDPLSATLLHQLVLSSTARFIVTVRSNEPVADAVTALWKDGLLGHVDIATLTRQEMTDLVEAVVGGPLESLSAERLHRITEGNPLFVRHIVEAALTVNSFREVEGVWQLRGDMAISQQLDLLIDARLRRLPDAEMEVMRFLAFQEVLEVDILAALGGRAAVEEAEKRGLVRISAQGPTLVARLAHPLYGEVIRARTATLTAYRVRGELVRRLRADATQSPSRSIQITALAMESDSPPAIDAVLGASRTALRLGDLALGERLARSAMSRSDSLEALLLLGNSLAWQGRGDEAEAALGAVDHETLAEPDLLAWTLPRAANMFWMLDEPDRAISFLRSMRPRMTTPPTISTLNSLHAMFTLYVGEPAAAVTIAGEVLGTIDAPPLARAWGAASGALAQSTAGKPDAVAEFATHGLAAATEAETGLLRFSIAFAQVRSSLVAGDPDGADALAAESLAAAGLQQPGRAIAEILVHRVALERGHFDSAATGFHQSAAGLTRSGFSWELLACTHLAQATAAVGRSTDAVEALRRAETLYSRRAALFRPELEMARAWVAAARDDDWEAIRCARVAASTARDTGQVAVALAALHLAMRFGDNAVTDEIDELAASVDASITSYPTLLASHARAFSTGDARQLLACAGAFETRGVLCVAADAAAQAATVSSARGDRALSFTASTRARGLADACGGARTPALLRMARPVALTDREFEIASMVAAGLTNKTIAERLVVSVRTVEGHVYRACAKVGVDDRAALTDVINGARPGPATPRVVHNR